MKDKRLGKQLLRSDPKCPNCETGYMEQVMFTTTYTCNVCGCVYERVNK